MDKWIDAALWIAFAVMVAQLVGWWTEGRKYHEEASDED